MQVVNQYSDRYGNTVGVTADGRQWLMAVYNTQSNRLETQRPPKPYTPIGQPQQSQAPTHTVGNQMMNYNASPIDQTPELDELGRAITTKTTQTTPVAQQPQQKQEGYIVSSHGGLLDTIVEKASVDGDNPWDINLNGTTLAILTTNKQIQLSDGINSVVKSWLEKIAKCEMPSVKPSSMDRRVNEELSKMLSAIMPNISFESLIDDYNDLHEFFECPDYEGDKNAFMKYMSEFLILNSKKSYKEGETINMAIVSLVFSTDNLEITDELMNIDTLSTLPVPDNAMLMKALNSVNVTECYVRCKEKTFKYANNKIRIHHVS